MPRSEGGDKSVSGKCLTSQDDAPMLRAGATLRKRQGRLLRKYALVFGALVGGTLIAGSLVQLYFSYQQSQAAVLQIERVEASRAALAISQFVDSMKAQIVGILPAPGRDLLRARRLSQRLRALLPRRGTRGKRRRRHRGDGQSALRPRARLIDQDRRRRLRVRSRRIGPAHRPSRQQPRAEADRPL